MRPKLYKVVVDVEVIASSPRAALGEFLWRIEQTAREKMSDMISVDGEQLDWANIVEVFPVDVSDWEEEEEEGY